MSREDLENRGESSNKRAINYSYSSSRDTNWKPWLIPLLLIVNIVVFVVLMYVNNCPKHNRFRLHGKCVARFLGRFSFQPLRENPLFGASSDSWSSKKQEVIAQSTAEAEFVAATTAVNQLLWIEKVLAELHFEDIICVEVFVDNKAAISISQYPVFHGRTKHFRVKFFFIRDVQQQKEVKLVYCKSLDQLADIFTKPLPSNIFEDLRRRIDVCSNS